MTHERWTTPDPVIDLGTPEGEESYAAWRKAMGLDDIEDEPEDEEDE